MDIELVEAANDAQSVSIRQEWKQMLFDFVVADFHTRYYL
jgi:hypothetical protein